MLNTGIYDDIIINVSIKFVMLSTNELAAVGTAIATISLIVVFLGEARGELIRCSLLIPSFLNLWPSFLKKRPSFLGVGL